MPVNRHARTINSCFFIELNLMGEMINAKGQPGDSMDLQGFGVAEVCGKEEWTRREISL
jgi:hypothetical protein